MNSKLNIFYSDIRDGHFNDNIIISDEERSLKMEFSRQSGPIWGLQVVKFVGIPFSLICAALKFVRTDLA